MLHRTGRVRGLRTALLTALGTALAAGPASAAAVDRPATTPPASDRVIVVWEDGVSRAERLDARADADAAFVRTLGDARFQLVRPDAGQSAGELAADLRAQPDVAVAERDGYARVNATTNDPLFGQLWGLFNTGIGVDGFAGAVPGADVDAPTAWDRTRGTPSTLVAIIDSGHRYDHPDLAPVTAAGGYDFVGSNIDEQSQDANPTDDDPVDGGHGSHVAGTAAAAGNNGVGITGVAQDARILPLRVCSYSPSSGSGGWCLTSAQIDAIIYAGRSGARVANMSLGGAARSDAARAALESNGHVLFVVSAGNGGSDGRGDDNDVTPQYPCAYELPNVVCVAATNQADQLAGFSNYGDVSVDLAAPGTETLSAFPNYAEHVPPLFADDFQGGDFVTRWTTAGGGFAAAVDEPLTSTGITDTPGSAPAASRTYEAALRAGVTVPAGYDACRLTGSRNVKFEPNGLAQYQITVGAVTYTFTINADTRGSGMASFNSTPVPVTPGQTLSLRVRFRAPASPTRDHGVWFDDLAVRCSSPVSAPPTYDYLQGTSMAAPHVTGAAALAFSLKPTATVAEVRAALLSTVDPLPALAGKTVTGGRLNVAAALNALVPPGGTPPGGDPPVVAPPVVTPPVVTPPTTPPTTAASVRCRVPRLAGMSLRRARRALAGANCVLGRVTRPRARRGRRLPPLVVKSSRPGARSDRRAGTAVAVTLKVKPPRRARRRAVRRR